MRYFAQIAAFFALIFFLTSNSFAQRPFFRHYTVNEGLAGSNVYSCYQDTKGYLWFSTETGVSRFDGLEFESFSIEDGLADTEVFGVREDSEGRIWFLTYNGKLSYYKDGIIFNSSTDVILKKLEFNYYIKDIYEDVDGNIWIGSFQEGIKVMTKNKRIFQFNSKTGTYNDVIRFHETDTGLIAFRKKSYIVFEGTEFRAFKATQCEQRFYRWNNGSADEHLYKICSDGFYRMRGDLNVRLSLPGTFVRDVALSLMEDQDGDLWVGTKGDGLLRISNYQNRLNVKRYLHDATISHIYQDHEKNLWICTFEEGVYFHSVNNFLSYTRTDGLSHNFLASVAVDENNVLVGTSEGNINLINLLNDSIRKVDLRVIENEFNKVTGIVVDDEKNIWAGTDYGLMIKSLKSRKPTDFRNLGSCKYIYRSDNNNILVGTSKGAFIARGCNKDSLKEIWSKRTLAIQEEKDGTLWLGTLNGLYKKDKNGEVLPIDNPSPLLKKRITEIKSMTDGTMLIGTYGHGLILYKEGEPLVNIKKRDGILSNFIRSITVGDNGELFISSDRGLTMITFDIDRILNTIRNYTDADGLISHDVRSCAIKNDTVFIATSSGLTFFDLRNPRSNYLPPVIHFKGLRVNDQNFAPKDRYVFEHDENNVIIDFTAISFESMGDIRFMYRMQGVDNDWVETRNNFVSYPSLESGKYIFELWAYSKNDKESKRPITMFLHIRPHFTQTFWFKLVIIIVLSMAFFLIIMWRINYIKKTNEVGRKIIELEQKALRTQMNPHFIFNTMSSIQQFVNSNDKKAANRYLSKFATLMRGILHNSDKQFVSLKDEVELLEIYLELEALRMSNKFDYEIKVDPGVDAAFSRIPPMLIQPFVENAILHGLANLDERKGMLKIHVIDMDEFIQVSIEDNGIGRTKAAEIKAKRTIKHESTAMKNVQERISLIQADKQDIQQLNVIDLYDENGTATGTRVEVVIPYH